MNYFTFHSDIYTRRERYIDIISGFCAACLFLYLIIQSIKNEQSLLVKQLTHKSLLQQEDLILARNLQKQVLDYKPKSVSGFDFSVKIMPSLELGGDLFDLSRPEESRLRIFLADAQGHGVNAALSSMLINSSWKNLNSEDHDPATMLKMMNSDIIASYGDSLSFTAIVCDVSKSKIVFSSAGHPSQYLIQEQNLIALENSGPPAGMFENSEYKNKELHINKNSRLLLYTDALIEEIDAIDINGKEWLEKTLVYIEGSSEDYIQNLIEKFAVALKQDTENLSLHDDLMILTIQLG